MKFKKLMALALAGTLALAISGCGGSASTSSTDSTEATTEESTDTAAEDTGDTEAADDEAEEVEVTEEVTEPTGDSYTVGVVQLVQHPALDAATEGFETALSDELGDNVEVDVQNAAGDSAQCATIANTFVSSGVDLIMGNATAALQAAQAATADIPVVGTSITDYATALSIDDWSGTTGMNVTGYSDLAPLDQQADMVAEWFPADTYPNVGILYCTAEPNSKYQSEVITGYLEDEGYTVTEYTFADSNDVSSVAETACQDSDVIYIPTDNTAASCTGIIREIALPAKTPIIAGEEGIMEGCGVATLSISYYDMGYQAGLMAADILENGTDPATTEIGYAKDLTKKYNPQICEELGIEPIAGYEAMEVSEEEE
ncbi:MAG: ABC transporter substrate-binding protein [Lachnospiraceae bacterium]|nr:ABC transporter substrate-binding protein [Lachnospiraceae bacterium]